MVSSAAGEWLCFLCSMSSGTTLTGSTPRTTAGGRRDTGPGVAVVTAVLDVIFTGVQVVMAETLGGGGGGRAVGLTVLHTLGG